MKEYNEYMSRYTEYEMDWMNKLSKHSNIQTNLKAMKKMDVNTDRYKYVMNNIHMLDDDKKRQYFEMEDVYKWRSKYIHIPSCVLSSSYFIYKIVTKPVTKSISIDFTMSICIAVSSYLSSMYINHYIHSYHTNTYFTHILSSHMHNNKR